MRRSGVLMHITSLPSPDGIGSLGKEAYAFADWLKAAGFSIWQVLPVGPTGYGESPYQSTCTFAGNANLIDIFKLEEDGLLANAENYTKKEIHGIEDVKKLKQRAIRHSFAESFEKVKAEVKAFTDAHPHIEEYALFMAVRKYFDGKMWSEWPDVSIRMREKTALESYMRQLADDINLYRYEQYLFYRQWKELKSYCEKLGIAFLGDMPIYVAEDSADCWANQKLFQVDRDGRPVKVAGVPPDYFSEDGQLWGNPLYNWKAIRRTKYKWWIDRLNTAGELFSMVRIDHFIGFANYYAIKAGSKNASVGKWEKAPGFWFFRRVKKEVKGLEIVAEDLGVVSRRVKRLLKFCGYPGMRVLQFGFNDIENNPHFVHNIVTNCLLYSGTHDNDTAEGWWANQTDEGVRKTVKEYMPDRSMFSISMIEAVLGSIAETAIIPMQDILGLGSEARMNTPGTVGGTNWMWRMPEGALKPALAAEMREINEFYNRIR